MIADFRSDTLTMPTDEMRQVMAEAPLGDDVFMEDPSINALEEKIAAMFGMEAAIFCPSGTMTNQIAIKLHTRPGDELICDQNSHIYLYEGGGIAANSGVQVQLVKGDRGRISLNQVKALVKADDPHFPNTSLVCTENTSNKGGGSIYRIEDLKELSDFCRSQGLAFHLDGARVFNAINEANYGAKDLGQLYDSISVCFSKGLGAPVGSALISTKANIHKARRIRKSFGGGMRQAGMLAAAASYALDHHVDRMKEDHRRAKLLESELSKIDWIKHIPPVDTNIVVIELEESYPSAGLIEALKQENVLAVNFGLQKIRLVTHLDIDDSKTQMAISAFNKLSPS